MPPRSRILELVQDLRSRGQYSPESLERALEQIDPSTLPTDDAKAWYETWGTAASERGDASVAIRRFQEGLARYPDHSALAIRLRNEQARNRVDLALDRSVKKAGKYVPEEVEKALIELRSELLREEELIAWHQAYSAAAMRRQDRAAALRRYKTGVAEFPNAPSLRFGLGQELEASGDIEAAVAEFAQARFPGVRAEYALVVSQYAFLWHRPELGTAALEPIVALVLGHGIFDSHFLHARGWPQAERLFGFAVGLAWQAGNDRLLSLLSRLEPHLVRMRDEAGAMTEPEIRATVSQRAEAMIEALERASQKATGGREECNLRLLAWRALAAPGANFLTEWSQRASGPLRWAVEAAVAHRRGDTAAESKALAEIEPESLIALQVSNIVSFGLLPYSETLRQRYVAHRKPVGSVWTKIARLMK